MKTKITAEALSGIRVAIFDLDGTLFDSTRLWRDIDDIFLRKRGYEPTAEYYSAIAALGFRNTAHFTIDYYKLADTAEELMSEWSELALDAYAHDIKLLDGAKEYVAACSARGIKIFAVTSLSRELAEPCLKNNGIFEFFDGLVTADETGFAKTDPRIYLRAAELAGVSPEDCVVFDDVPQALRAARSAGCVTVAVIGDGVHFNSDSDRKCADMNVSGMFEAPEIQA